MNRIKIPAKQYAILTLITIFVVICLLLTKYVKTQLNFDKKAIVLPTQSFEIELCEPEQYVDIRVSPYKNIDYINNDAYEIINAAYKEIDFFGIFKPGNVELYDYYKEKYNKLLKCEATFPDKETKKNYYISGFKEMDFTYSNNSTYCGTKDIYDYNNYMYYFFDIDCDGKPELCVTDEARFIYIFKYIPNSDSYILWHEIPPSGIHILGSRKLWYYGGGTSVEYAFYYLA